ncbi:hypothetical protein J4E85_009171 [Alternaria conjuncta]|uniref:uncharacterized protein n=1 Tax=Alternaria conjuncta TaxID=181017 RepID=UPI0022205842|nr:uncharacterized protein J4E85_009171 [Alternaria conjuncta]KAI4920404.1 hypothetical protein J4E85_009171 [Alternaria conjuncta]
MVVLTDSSPWNKAIAARNQRTSPLLKLPDELRNRIYGYVLGNRTWDVGYCHEKRDCEDKVYEVFRLYENFRLYEKFRLYEETEPNHYRTKSSFGSPLLEVSRQIHSEAWLLFFSHSKFAARRSMSFFLWLESLPDVARLAISSVDLGDIRLPIQIEGDSIVVSVYDALYPRTSFSPIDVQQRPASDSSWDHDIFDSLGDLYRRLPGLKNLHLTVNLVHGSQLASHQLLDSLYIGISDEEVKANLRLELAKIFALPDVHVNADLILPQI